MDDDLDSWVNLELEVTPGRTKDVDRYVIRAQLIILIINLLANGVIDKSWVATN